MENVIERFLRYVQIPSASAEGIETSPSTPDQWNMARALASDMKAIGIADARVDEYGYVYGSIPANRDGQPVIGLIAHLDVVDGVPCAPVRPRIVKNYDGGAIQVGNGVVLDPKEFQNLIPCVGKDIIVTDGTTILGADDKAGVAEIMCMAETLIENPDIPHGEIQIAFTPDEEVGGGAEKLDIAAFGAEFAYTVDGGELGGIEYENFNAASARVRIKGVNIHPGSAKNKMKNAALIATEFAALLPAWETPAHTEKYEGFFHLTGIRADEENASLSYIIRDHDRERFEKRKRDIRTCADFINARYGEGTAELELRDSYRNMREVLEKRMDVVDRALDAFRACEVEPFVEPIRGGTDGARLSWRGLPCPNLSTGGMNGHGRAECACAQDMEKMVDVLIEIVRAR